MARLRRNTKSTRCIVWARAPASTPTHSTRSSFRRWTQQPKQSRHPGTPGSEKLWWGGREQSAKTSAMHPHFVHRQSKHSSNRHPPQTPYRPLFPFPAAQHSPLPPTENPTLELAVRDPHSSCFSSPLPHHRSFVGIPSTLFLSFRITRVSCF